jgi:Rod binding domain-containing protein
MVPIAYERTTALGGAAKATSGVDPRLKSAAQDFEASMMQELLKPMERDPLFSSSHHGGGGLGGGDAGMGTWSSLGAQSLAKVIVQAGGLGIATTVIQQVEAEAKQVQDMRPAEGVGAEKGSKAGSAPEESPIGGEALAGWSTVRRQA